MELSGCTEFTRRSLKISVSARFVREKSLFLKQDSLREKMFVPSVTEMLCYKTQLQTGRITLVWAQMHLLFKYKVKYKQPWNMKPSLPCPACLGVSPPLPWSRTLLQLSPGLLSWLLYRGRGLASLCSCGTAWSWLTPRCEQRSEGWGAALSPLLVPSPGAAWMWPRGLCLGKAGLSVKRRISGGAGCLRRVGLFCCPAYPSPAALGMSLFLNVTPHPCEAAICPLPAANEVSCTGLLALQGHVSSTVWHWEKCIAHSLKSL